jgi:hypothetical protein
VRELVYVPATLVTRVRLTYWRLVVALDFHDAIDGGRPRAAVRAAALGDGPYPSKWLSAGANSPIHRGTAFGVSADVEPRLLRPDGAQLSRQAVRAEGVPDMRNSRITTTDNGALTAHVMSPAAHGRRRRRTVMTPASATRELPAARGLGH